MEKLVIYNYNHYQQISHLFLILCFQQGVRMDLGGTECDLQSYEDEQLVVRMTEIAAAERQQQVQMMLSKQLDTGGSLEE